MGTVLCNKGLPTQVIQGSSANIDFYLIDESTGRPFPLAAVTGATATFAAGAGGAYAASAMLISQDLAHFQAQLMPADTMALLTGDNLDAQIAVDQGSVRTIGQVLGLLSVAPQLFQS